VKGEWAFALYTSTHLSLSDYLYKTFEEVTPVFRMHEFYRVHGTQNIILAEKLQNGIPPSTSSTFFFPTTTVHQSQLFKLYIVGEKTMNCLGAFQTYDVICTLVVLLVWIFVFTVFI
jgi:hypothetical protein